MEKQLSARQIQIHNYQTEKNINTQNFSHFQIPKIQLKMAIQPQIKCQTMINSSRERNLQSKKEILHFSSEKDSKYSQSQQCQKQQLPNLKAQHVLSIEEQSLP